MALRDNGAQPFSDEQLDMMAAFVDEAALAWQLATSQRRMREVDVLTDRDRIARDSTITSSSDSSPSDSPCREPSRSTEVQQRLSDSVDDLQGVIQEIRTMIFDLHGAPAESTRLRQRLDEAIAQFSGSDLRTTGQFTGPLSMVDAALADHVEACPRSGQQRGSAFRRDHTQRHGQRRGRRVHSSRRRG